MLQKLNKKETSVPELVDNSVAVPTPPPEPTNTKVMMRREVEKLPLDFSEPLLIFNILKSFLKSVLLLQV